MTWVTASATGVFALFNWSAVAHGRARLEWWSKLLTMSALVATTLSAGALEDSAGRWLVAALMLGLLGDYAMLGDTERRLLGGVAAFLAGHLAYLGSFAMLGVAAERWWVVALLVLGTTSWATRGVVPSAWRVRSPGLAVPLAAYTLVIGAMTVLAFLTGEPLIALGATLFVTSDSLIACGLARSGFRHEDRSSGSAHLAVMITYHASQVLLAAGVLLAR